MLFLCSLGPSYKFVALSSTRICITLSFSLRYAVTLLKYNVTYLTLQITLHFYFVTLFVFKRAKKFVSGQGRELEICFLPSFSSF
jgi:hypothetical protein